MTNNEWIDISSERFDRITDALQAIKDRGGAFDRGQWVTSDGRVFRVERTVGGFKLITSKKVEGAK